MSVWEEKRRKQNRNRLWINTCLPPRCSRAEMLKILTDMAIQNEWRPGQGPSQDLERGVIPLDADNKPCNLESVCTWSRTPSLRLQESEPPMRWPIAWPKCLGRGLPHAPPTPPSILTSSSESDSSSLPFLESITEPESSYEASDSSSND